VVSFPKAHFFMLFVDKPSSKSTIKAFPLSSPSLKTIEGTQNKIAANPSS
jgi:hypothetical protein